MPDKPPPPIKTCAVCGVTMLAGKSDESLTHFDTFNCLNCGMIVSYRKSEIRNRKSEA